MKSKDNEKFVKLGLTGMAVVAGGLVLSFVFSRADAIAAFLGSVGKILMPFVYGAVIAYLLAPLCNRLQAFLADRLSMPRKGAFALSIVLALVLAVVLVVALLILIIPNVVTSVIQIVSALPAQMTSAAAWLSDQLASRPELQAQWEEFSDDVVTQATSWLQTDLTTTLQTLVGSLSVQFAGFVTAMKNFFMGLLISVYLLANRKKFAVQARLLLGSVVPRSWADVIEREVRYADRMFNGFLVGRIIDSVIIGIICFVFTGACGFDSAVLVSVVVGVTNVVPVFGPLLGAVPCAIVLLLENPLHCLIFIVFVVVLQLIDGNVIGPRILGETTGVDSFWVLFAVLLFGGLWGLPGMIVGVPLFAVIYDIVRTLTYRGLRKRGRDDLLGTEQVEEPGEPEEAEPAETS